MGFVRIVTDYSTLNGCVLISLWIFRVKDIGKWLLECIISFHDLQGLQHFVLATRDAPKSYLGQKFNIIWKNNPNVFYHIYLLFANINK